MRDDDSAGRRLRQALAEENPLQVVGAVNAYCARQAERAGFRALYLSGAGVANASYGLPDLGMTTLDDVLIDARRITGASQLPLLVDCDTGWGSPQSIAHAVRAMTAAGVAAIHLEDQVDTKRCGHRPGKRLVGTSRMCDRLKAAVDARTDPGFVIMARTDAVAGEGLEAAIDRARSYVAAGADMVFAEALESEDQFRRFAQAIDVPMLANMTEFGKSPLLTLSQLRAAGVRLVLYPLTAFRAMSAAADNAYRTLRQQGTQSSLLPDLQTREELYDLLDYHGYEQQMDELLQRDEESSSPSERKR